jgi:bifunctional non-homologous end joining protein LigD
VAKKSEERFYELDGVEVRLTSPGKLLFPRAGVTKGQLADFYVEIADALLNQIGRRPTVLKRYRDGIEAEPFYQKRIPEKRPEWLQTVVLKFPSGREARELVPVDRAHLVWTVQQNNIDWNVHPTRSDELDHPDELRVDLDPMPECDWAKVREVAMVAKEVLDEHGLVGFPKTSGSKGMHINVRLHQRWDFVTVRRAAVAIAREVERRAEGRATALWWREQRPQDAVFVDYNQNAKDHTVAAGYSVRPVADARVSTPLTWDEVPESDPREHTIFTVVERLQTVGDPSADIDAHPCDLTSILAQADADEQERGLQDAPWPMHTRKQPNEPKRVQPSRDRDNPNRKGGRPEKAKEIRRGEGWEGE